MLRKSKCAVLVGFAGLAGGCTPDAVRDAAKPPPSCKPELANIDDSFKPLPAGYEYAALPKKEVAADQREMSDVAIAYDERAIEDVGAVTVTVFKAPFGPGEEDAFKRGLAQEAGMPGEKWEDVRLGSTTVTYVHNDEHGFYARVFGSGCRAVLVVGLDDAQTRRLARAVLG